MTDVFISYSRQNQKFVKKLEQALCHLNQKIWVEGDNMPLTADGWQ